MKHLSLLVTLLFVGLIWADDLDIYRDVELNQGNYVALYDCDIYRAQLAYDQCRDLQRKISRSSWFDSGYAIDCNNFSSYSDRNKCGELSDYVMRDRDPFKCQSRYITSSTQERRCELVKRSYARGFFESTIDSCPYDDDRDSDFHYQPAEITDSYDYCYKRAKDEWERQREINREQEEKGKTDVAVGTGLFILGRIIDAASGDDRTGQIIGGVTSGLGVALASYGAYEWASATMRPPYEYDICRQHYTTEQKRVVINRQQCVTTRYYSRSWNHESYYFKTVCSTQTFYSFEANSQIW